MPKLAPGTGLVRGLRREHRLFAPLQLCVLLSFSLHRCLAASFTAIASSPCSPRILVGRRLALPATAFALGASASLARLLGRLDKGYGSSPPRSRSPFDAQSQLSSSPPSAAALIFFLSTASPSCTDFGPTTAIRPFSASRSLPLCTRQRPTRAPSTQLKRLLGPRAEHL